MEYSHNKLLHVQMQLARTIQQQRYALLLLILVLRAPFITSRSPSLRRPLTLR